MDSTGYIGIVAGVLTSISLLPQLIKIIKEKKADDISYFTLGVLITGVALWVWYGIEKSDIPIITTNAFSVLVNLLMIIFTIRYKQK
jgi:MtN3 and saliva related transmembrane protein